MQDRRRSGGGGRGRDVSRSPPKSQYHQKSEWHPNSRRSRPSAPIRDHSHRLSPSRARRSASIEKRRDYAPTSSTHSDFGKQQQLLYDHSPSVLPSQSHSNRPTRAFGAEGSGSYDNIHEKYDLYLESRSRANEAVEGKDFHLRRLSDSGDGAFPSSLGVGLDGRGVLVQKSMHLDDGSHRTFFMLPPEHGDYLSDAAALNGKSIGSTGSISTLRLGARGNEELQYHEHSRRSYAEAEKQNMRSRDLCFPSLPSSQSRAFVGSSSSGLQKDDVLGSYRTSLRLSPARFCTSSNDGKFTYHQLDNDGYCPLQPIVPIKQVPLSPPVREEHRGYSYSERQREKSVREFILSDYLPKKMSWGLRGDSRELLEPCFVDSFRDKIGEEQTSSSKVLRDSSLWQHPSVEGGAELNYHGIRSICEEYDVGSGNVPVRFQSKSLRDCEFPHEVKRYDYSRDFGGLGYGGRSKNSVSESYLDIYRRDMSPSFARVNAEDISNYDPSTERIMERNYMMDDDMDASNSGSMLPNSWNASEGIRESNGDDELWASEDRVGLLPSKRLGVGRTRYKTLSRRLTEPDAWLPSRGSTVRLQGVRENLKKRLRPGYSDFHESHLLERRHDSYRPYKVWKKSLDDQDNVMNSHDDDTHKGETLLVKRDPPEDSDEFKQQVHKAFLRFSKVLNENLRQQRKFREQGKAGSLSCYVCGSISKEFVNTHSLVAHAFMSLKVGLRTDHLGLHKALCVLMDWNWQVPPDNSRIYQSQPVAQAKALKEDLILWPPVVIIRNSSIGNRNIRGRPKVVSIEDMEKILRGMGFGAGKTQVRRGSPANQSILLVKFMPTFSGLQEAERLHKHYADNNRGRKEFQGVTSISVGGGSSGAEAASVVVEQLLYGHMGIADDLDKLDPDTKKRCLVKSKKDIEAIADAPLVTD